MDLDQDFRDLLTAFEKAEARYLLIGGYAVSIHCRPWYTKDIGLWIDRAADNLDRVAAALEEFGAPTQAIADVKICRDDEIVWFGSPSGRIDILKQMPGVDFASAYDNRASLDIEGVSVSVIAIPDLIRAKLAAGRPQDLLDVEALRAITASNES